MSNPSGSADSEKDQNGVTTLFIRPWAGKRNLRYDKILSHFSTFGDVKSVRICNKMNYSYGFVKFALPESAAKALEVDVHEIAGRRMKIAVADDKHQDLRSNEHTTTFLNLSDDCLLEILSKKCLTKMDLCAAAETCRRLKEIARQVFKREHNECDIRSLCGYEAEPAKRILMNFGSDIRHLEIIGVQFSDELVRLGNVLASVREYCSNTLQSLHVFNTKIRDAFTTNLRPLFKNLQKLRIDCCTIEGGSSRRLFANCGSLIELVIRHSDEIAALTLEKSFPKLQQFHCHCGVNSNLLTSFISRHMNLNSLRIGCYVELSVLQLIANCWRLETLTCCIPEDATLDLTNLSHLRELSIFCKDRNISEKAVGLDSLRFLESLKLSFAEIDSQFVRNLSQLNRLQTLELCGCTALQDWNQLGYLNQLTSLEIRSYEQNDLDVTLLVQRLSKLNSLRIVTPRFKMDLETYSNIVDVVRRRPDRAKLTIQLGRSDSYDDLLPVFQRNAHIVKMVIN